MSVIIDNLDVPNSCESCYFRCWSNFHQTSACELENGTPAFDDYSRDYLDKKPGWCPIKEFPHGYWIDTGSGQECSRCHEVQYGYDSGRYYCQNCGAKMLKENNGE